jgi:hypothetical protein
MSCESYAEVITDNTEYNDISSLAIANTWMKLQQVSKDIVLLHDLLCMDYMLMQ